MLMPMHAPVARLEQPRPDMDIEADARDAIATLDTANSTGMAVNVSVFEGEVTLTGHIRSEMVTPGIQRMARSVAGARRLVNQLVDDTSLVRRLASVLALDPRTQAIPPGYQVVSHLGHTLIVGAIASGARAAVSQVCAEVAGVRSVEIRALDR